MLCPPDEYGNDNHFRVRRRKHRVVYLEVGDEGQRYQRKAVAVVGPIMNISSDNTPLIPRLKASVRDQVALIRLVRN